MTVTVLHGDSLSIMASMEPDSVDAIVTDPPYGETSLTWDAWPPGWPAIARRVLKPAGSMWVFGSVRMFLERTAEFAGWKFAQDVVWEKHNGTGLFNDRFRRVHEHALQFYRDDSPWTGVFKDPQFTNDATARTVRRKSTPAHWTGTRNESAYRSEDGGPRLQRSVIYARSEHGHAEHPTQKPVGIVQPLIAYSCPPGGTVLDCFAGSGTTGVVARRLGMNAILIEANEAFVATIHKRIHSDAPLFDGEV